MKRYLETAAAHNPFADKLLAGITQLAALPFIGSNVQCPICLGVFRTFIAGGQYNERPGAKCPRCRSLERHRAVWYFLQKEQFIQTAKRLLLIAPEYGIRRGLAKIKKLQFVSADLDDPRSQCKMDVTQLAFAANRFDSLLCMHVLEHVANDLAALNEFFRVLAPKGWAVIQVPVKGEKTIEDNSADTPGKRLKLFGQEDHVRQYGEDFEERLRSAGFETRVVPITAYFSEKEIVRHGLLAEQSPEEKIYFCRKPA